MQRVYLKNNFFFALGFIALLFILSYTWPFFYVIAKSLFFVVIALVFINAIYLLRSVENVSASRYVNPKLSLGDDQEISYLIKNDNSIDLDIDLVDELPVQFQHRDTIAELLVARHETKETRFLINPKARGVYTFGDLHVYCSLSFFSFVAIKKSYASEDVIEVVPSIIQMKKYELQVFSRTARNSGIRRVRQIGENDEFEHIRNYSQGDNVKAINWKATSRRNQIMLNQYQNTKSQNVYCIVDKGRAMKMPFKDLTLLDYAINSTLVISNIVLKKYDKLGLITFSNKIGALVKAASTRNQLEKISSNLYHQKTEFKESSIELLNITIRKKVSRRSILILFTNFENQNDLQRNLPYFKSINNRHLLLVVFFINTELLATGEMQCKTADDIYLKTFAQRALIEKEKIKLELNANGINAILTKPEDLSISVINKYLEIKAKRML